MQIDKSGNGKLDRREVRHALQMMGKKEVEIRAVLDEVQAAVGMNATRPFRGVTRPFGT